MQSKSNVLAVAAALALGAGAAMADDVHQTVSLVNQNAAFQVVHTETGWFHDEVHINLSGEWQATVSGITISLLPAQDIDFISASLNGHTLELTSSAGDMLESFYTSTPLTVTGPLTLTITGNAYAGNGINASYAGTINVAAVPEPETYALMVAGLGIMGFVARRRKS